MKNVQIFYNCAFCRAGILVCLESDHITRGRQGIPTHFLSQGGNTLKEFCTTIPPTDTTSCCPVSQLFLFWPKLTCGLLYLSTEAGSRFCLLGSLSSPPSPSSSWDVTSTYIKLWNLRFWRYFLTLQGCICTVPCYLLLYYYSYNGNLLTTWYLIPFQYK